MKGLDIEKEDIINVADNAEYKNQTEMYNKEFKEWRKNKDNPYGYNFIHNKKESVYIDGLGFVTVSAREAEEKTLFKISKKIGIALLMSLAISKLGILVAFWIANILGAGISAQLFQLTGNPPIVGMITSIVTILQYTVPAIYLSKTFKLSETVSLPRHIENKYELLLGVSTLMVVGVIVSVILLFLDNYLSQFGLTGPYKGYPTSFASPVFIIYIVLEVICTPILCELLFRSSMLHVLRQFGDWFAIIVTSFLSTLVLNNIWLILFATILMIIPSIFSLRSGSITTSIIMRMSYKLYIFIIIILNNESTKIMTLFMICIFVLAIVGVCLTYKKVDRRKLVSNKTALNTKQKIFHMFFSPTMSIWLLLSIVISIVTL